MSRFVSGGTIEEPTERDEAWLKAQQELEARHKEKVEAREKDDGKSLYEKLQANKDAKQEAFEESIRLKNQFRSLDEDEVDFLDSVLESTRAKEAAVKQDTKAQLEAFRKQQEEAEKATVSQDDDVEAPVVVESWASGLRKRKKGKEKEGIAGLKLRKTSTIEKATATSVDNEPEHTKAEAKSAGNELVKDAIHTPGESIAGVKPRTEANKPVETKSPSPPAVLLGLASYSSDED